MDRYLHFWRRVVPAGGAPEASGQACWSLRGEPGEGAAEPLQPPASSHAFRAQTAADPALQRPQQELLRDQDPSAGQQRDRVHPVRGEHGAGVPGGCGSEAGVTRGKGSPGQAICHWVIGHVFSSGRLCLWVMLFSGLARYDQQLELGQTHCDCMRSDGGAALGALGGRSSITALRALCNVKFLFLESHEW